MVRRDLITKIENSAVYDVARETELEFAPELSSRLHNKIYLKREDKQPVFSFKLRGAYNKIIGLSPHEKSRGVITASAGNHAQGVALAARQLSIRAVIVMPRTTPKIKVDAVQALGAKTVLHGDTYDEAYIHSQKLAHKNQLVFIHPYDDIDVIAGQGTIGKEIMEQADFPIAAIFVPVGGGGLIAGIAQYVKHCRPEIRIIGVEPQDAAGLYHALKAKQRVELAQVGIFADGVAVRQIGKLTFELIRDLVDEVVRVTTDEICAAIKDIFDDTRALMEPAGALAVAGIKKYIQRNSVRNLNFIAINSGANINFDRLRYVAERAELGERRECLFAVTIPEKKGSFRKFCRVLGKRGITEFNYRYAGNAEAHIFVGINVDNAEAEKTKILAKLRKNGYPVLDITENEMAILHLRHLVGGRSPHIVNEILFRFEFPERPGALMQFLDTMGQIWNISLFHYRNHGAAYGRVLVGIQVPASQRKRFNQFLEKLGYPYWEETYNPAYKLFL